MKGSSLTAAVLALSLACNGERARSTDSSSANPSAVVPPPSSSSQLVRWPSDPMKSQLGELETLQSPVPSCGDVTTIAGDSVGPLHVGQSLSAIARLCPRALALWDLGDEGIPAPVLIVRLRATRFELAFEDTLPTSALISISATDSTARTAEGVGPGSAFASLTTAYGKPTLEEGECVLNVTFARRPGLAFRLDTGKTLACERIPDITARNDIASLPANTRVQELTIYHPPPAT